MEKNLEERVTAIEAKAQELERMSRVVVEAFQNLLKQQKEDAKLVRDYISAFEKDLTQVSINVFPNSVTRKAP